ncbi:MAG: YggS family pyridoxal phosphate-dependent enzyme [Actinobacteria bacterium]|nr:YggS family pyridoxal phosphate-dependent enzyme [Actinomycetota bacterium]
MIFAKMTISDNLKIIRDRIANACLRSGRNADQVRIVAVSKTVDASAIESAIDAGVTIIGENRVQEAWRKFQQIERPVQWHLIGHLQTNKVKRALQFADVIESVDSLHLAKEVNLRAQERGKAVQVFVQVNTSGEASKFGVHPEALVDFLYSIADLQFLRITGLMTIGAFLPEPEDVRPCFSLLRQLRAAANAEKIKNIELEYLSMGMTNDFEVAVEEGATHVRIGRALFGKRED